MFGFLNVYKPKGKTSHDVVAVLRRVTKIKQIGHTGTLDPFAEGVLPICIGKATRLIEYLDDNKAYIGTVKLGKSTTTYDVEGEVVNVSDKKVSLENIEQALGNFRGEIQQVPPIYSAIKVNGKKLYEYARDGEKVEVMPRNVNIYKLEVVNFDEENQTLDLHIECSKGTYIRSIANDLGEVLGCYGHLIKLVRTKAGDFEVDKAIELGAFETKEQVEKSLICPIEYLNYLKYELDDVEKEKVAHGMAIKVSSENGLIIFVQKNVLIAVANVEGNIAKILKVFI